MALGVFPKASAGIGIGREIEAKSLRRLDLAGAVDAPCEKDSTIERKLPEMVPSLPLLDGNERESLRRVK